ncbi:conserved hypothetical protein [Anaeromyxobacter dehalogenans 2CP-1]|uniref:Uncharacterized protein n=1 Tax=Anaeromyxobacter dehalogenans (strain ATCC BAA-258 / DSM 21875 / 2CP-1) TaxID=455488 RepID=B8J716_ANAD2|nr:hypothetical protein [Anaeromyxobacter dehalogenans]ACL65206.1 conserved hypothetical protein [Anaeromyxobacter dehalogenans 2CP-1]
MSPSLAALLLSLAAVAPPPAEPPSSAAPGGPPVAQPAAPAPAPPTLREANLARAGKGLLPRRAPPRRAPRRLQVVSARDQVARAQQVGGRAAVELVAVAAAEPELEAAPRAGGAAWIAGSVIRGLAGGGGGRGGEPGARVEAEPGGLRAGARVASVEVTVRVRAGALALAAGSPGAAVRPLR